MASRKEKGRSDRFYGPPDEPRPRSNSRPIPPRRERVVFHAENHARSDDKSSTARSVLSGPQQRNTPMKTPGQSLNPQNDPTSTQSLSTFSVEDATSRPSAANSPIKETVVSFSEKRDASQFTSPLRDSKVHVTPATFEPTIPPLGRSSPESLFFPAWKEKIPDSSTASEQFLKVVFPKLPEDATKFGLIMSELMGLRSKARTIREKAYCMLRQYPLQCSIHP